MAEQPEKEKEEEKEKAPYVWMVQSEKDVMHYEPFRDMDSELLEAALARDESNVLLDGGRQEVSLDLRLMTPVYWAQRPRKVIRALWFFKSSKTGNWEPYSEADSASAESFYGSIKALKQAPEQCELFLSDGAHKLVAKETSPAAALLTGLSDTTIIEYASMSGEQDTEEELSPRSSTSSEATSPPLSPAPQMVRLSIVQQRHDGSGGRRAVLRGLPYVAQSSPQGLSSMDEEQDMPVEHLVLVVHGIGEALFSRDDFSSPSFRDSVRSMAALTLKQQMQKYPDVKTRIEFLPIEWYRAVHGTNPGFVDTLQSLTLPSLTRLRQFNHDVMMDIMYYMSPPYKQKIVNTVTHSLNAVHHKFMQRNPDFNGSISLIGFSLGSIILFDILSNQKTAPGRDAEACEAPDVSFRDPPSPEPPTPEPPTTEPPTPEPPTPEDVEGASPEEDLTKSDIQDAPAPGAAEADEEAADFVRKAADDPERTVGYTPGVDWPQLMFQPTRCFTLGAPIGMFLAVRDDAQYMKRTGFKLPTCDKFFNMFHPYDPVAYRIEPVLDDRLRHKTPVLIPHHTGRRRMHVQLRESFKDSAESISRTFLSMSSALHWRKSTKESSTSTTVETKAETQVELDEQEKQKVTTKTTTTSSTVVDVEVSGDAPQSTVDEDDDSSSRKHRRGLSSEDLPKKEIVDDSPFDLALNGGKRVDFQLQEAPLENANEYIAALGSHAGYFTSEDTCLFICKRVRSKEDDVEEEGTVV